MPYIFIRKKPLYASGDLLGRELILDADGSLGLDVDLMAEGLSGLYELLLGHVGVGDTAGASADSDEFHCIPLSISPDIRRFIQPGEDAAGDVVFRLKR